jgi:exopolysaccharide production protein ExoZ
VKTVKGLQILRALAATGVLVAHFQGDLARRFSAWHALPDLGLGNFGVDLFFVISGFVMVYASEPLFGRSEGPREFFLRRLIRIVPIYWLVTTLYLVLAVMLPAYGATYSLPHTIASYLFIPWPRTDGTMQPVVGQGWTLNYEMLFYALFACAIVLHRAAGVLLVGTVLVSAVAFGAVVELGEPLRFWSDPILLEFAFGMVLALLYRAGARLSAPVGWAVVAVGLATAAMLPLPTWGYSGARFLYWGVPALLVVTGIALGGLGASARWWPLVLVGEASYALYLLHAIPVRIVLHGATWAGLDVAADPWVYLAIAAVAAIALAIVVHVAFERPVTALLRAAR